ncbi:hypothetical protein JTE90_023872 [Oedothorax gibbosus]|uniref:Uncharacterized protein n=1 Tax=Oedothorax gibbosus TaxID=931172 RepID=A0AAV6UNF2_9ARAC|nr:hypothetical protein JTE90_023872 [Oedothorax gibbosus]
MASIGRWLYRQFAKCLSCLKLAETDEKEAEGYPQDLNPFENDAEEDIRMEKEYQDDLNPFASEEDENKNPNEKDEKVEKREQEDESLNPFASDNEEYPEELNPFADVADQAPVNQTATTLQYELTAPNSKGSLSVSFPGSEKTGDGKEESQKKEDDYPESLNPFASEDEENGYPDALNPFAEDEESEQDIEYPEELNPFAHEEDYEADPATVNQSSASLVPEQNPPATNGYSSTVPLPDEEKAEDGKNESERHDDEYTDSLNPFASEDEEDVYPEQLNPFAHEEDDEAAIEDGENEQYDDDYPEELNPFAHENQYSPKIEDAQQVTAAINDSSSTVPLAKVKKAKSMKKYRAPGPPVILSIVKNEESAPKVSEISGSVPVIYKAEDYDEALNPFASEDEENIDDTAGNLSSLAQLTVATTDGSSSANVASKNRKKVKSLKKRRAPEPPVIESKDSVSSDIKSNQPCASSCHPGTKESED